MGAKRCVYGTLCWCLLFAGWAVAQAPAGPNPPPQDPAAQKASQSSGAGAPTSVSPNTLPPAPPQVPPPPASGDSEHALKVETTLVQIPVAVTDSVNRFVLGLQKEDFHLYEDGVEQDIAHFSGEDAPLSVGLVFDESGSMGYKLRTAQDAATQFMKTMNSNDEAFLVVFSDTARLATDFTSNPDDIQNALTTAQPGGLTAMLDAINVAVGEMKQAKNPRKAIVIISDGGDNNSRYTSAQIEALVREADVQIYAMGVFDPILSLTAGIAPEVVTGPKLLSEIATQTGGRAFSATLTSDLPSVAARIAVELRNEYVLGYYPKNSAHDGKYRNVEVKISQPAGVSTVKPHWRQGYYAPSE